MAIAFAKRNVADIKQMKTTREEAGKNARGVTHRCESRDIDEPRRTLSARTFSGIFRYPVINNFVCKNSQQFFLFWFFPQHLQACLSSFRIIAPTKSRAFICQTNTPLFLHRLALFLPTFLIRERALA